VGENCYDPLSRIGRIELGVYYHIINNFDSGGGSTESQYLSKSTNTQINIYFSKRRSNTMTTILK